MNMYLDLPKAQKLFRTRLEFAGILKNITYYFLQNKPPSEMVMFTGESLHVKHKRCEILILVSETPHHLGRTEDYENCIFSTFSQDAGKIIILNDVTSYPTYLALDSRVKSEMFYESRISRDIGFILNTEFSTKEVPQEAKEWFVRMADLLS